MDFVPLSGVFQLLEYFLPANTHQAVSLSARSAILLEYREPWYTYTSHSHRMCNSYTLIRSSRSRGSEGFDNLPHATYSCAGECLATLNSPTPNLIRQPRQLQHRQVAARFPFADYHTHTCLRIRTCKV